MSMSTYSNLPNTKILITQPYSHNLACAYDPIVDKYGVDINFHSFIEHKPVPIHVFRKYKQDIKSYTSLLFTTRTSVDYFFKLSKSCSIKVDGSKKYFCATENLKNYLRKYIEYKKRRLFCGNKSLEELFPIIRRHKKESFLAPSSNEKKETLRSFFKIHDYKYKEIVIYDQVMPALQGLDPKGYDIIVFFSPLTVEAFAKSFPDYEQDTRQIAAFNEATAQSIEKMGWQTTLCPPRLSMPSIVDVLHSYLSKKISVPSSKAESKKRPME